MATKKELRKELDNMNIEYTEKDSVTVLKKKVAQAKLPAKSDPQLPFMLMDAEDENQILQEIQGAVLDTYIYSFREGSGKEVVGLSKAGVDQVCRESANKGEVYRVIPNEITGKPAEVEEDDSYIKVIVKVGRFALIKDKNGNVSGEQLLDTAIGSKRQAKKQRFRSGKVADNPFAYEVAISKAQRNAKRDLLPYKLITEMVKKFRNKGNIKVIQADRKINEAQLRFLHQKGSEFGFTHEKLKDLIKKEFGYESVNALNTGDVNKVVELIKEKGDIQAVPTMSVKLLGLFNVKGIMKAKRDAIWKKALVMFNGDAVKAEAQLHKQLAEK